MTETDSAIRFAEMTGHQPMPWQKELLGRFSAGIAKRTSLDVPTGLGKTSVMAAWLVAKSQGASLPRKLVYVVDRRAVVDQATREAEKLRSWVDLHPETKSKLGLEANENLPISTLRGQYVDNRQWLEDPSATAIIVGTVDMVGSQLLFEGYGVSRKMRPYHAGLLGSDTLFVLDEAHLVPPFEMMLDAVVSDDSSFGPNIKLAGIVPDIRLLSLSATGRHVDGDVVRLTDRDLTHPVVRKRLAAVKNLTFRESDGSQPLADLLAHEAWNFADDGRANVRIIVFSNSRDDAEKALKRVEKLAKGDKKKGIGKVEIATQLFVGARRVSEREDAATWLSKHGFLAGSENKPSLPSFVFATSAGEVGIDMDADHMACDLVEWERMVQRLGRVNRRGNGEANVRVIVEPPQPDKKTREAVDKPESDRTKVEQKKVSNFHAAKERIEILKRPIQSLPDSNGSYDASPGAIRNLKIESEDDQQLDDIIAAATSRSPLRPALTRPLVDAWSMTSLEKHTGRPLVAPWLRGWVDDKPQTTVVWRRYLPVCHDAQSTEKKRKADAKEFFEHAPLHLSETLDTESFRVLDWLSKRAKAIRKGFDDERRLMPKDDTGSQEPLKLESVVGMIVGRSLDVVRILKVHDLIFEGDDKKDNKRRKDALERDLRDNTLVLDRRFGGLSEHGLLNTAAKEVPRTADDDDRWTRLVGFRVCESADEATSADSDWRTCFRFVAGETADGEPNGFLIVEKWKQFPVSEDSRSISRESQKLIAHQQWAEVEADRLADRLRLPSDYAKMLRIAARLHDEGKACERWQNAFSAPADGRPYAKTLGPVKFSLLDGYRHEFGSLPTVRADPEFQELNAELQQLCLHLVAAHHGFARPVIRTNGCEDGPPSALEGRAREVALRFASLQRHWGPWGLAWWESLLRACDQRASRDVKTMSKEANNG